MSVGFPTKANWAAGDVLTASALDDLAGTVNLLSNASATQGSALLSNAAGTSFSYSPLNSAGKNYIINGGMDNWQRGTSFTTNAAYLYTADRFTIYTSASASWQRATDAPSATNLNYCLSNNGAVANWYIVTTVELTAAGVSQLTGTYTFSFYGKFDSGKTITVGAYYTDNSQGAYQQAASGTTTVTGTGAWARYTMTFVPSSVAPASTNTCMRFMIQEASGASNTVVRITGVQLELGSIPTTFSRAGGSIQGELQACRRYLPAYSVTDLIGYAYATNGTIYTIAFDTPARVAPTSFTLYSGTAFRTYALNTATVSTVNFNLGAVNGASVTSTSSTIVAGQGSRLTVDTGYILFTGCEL